MKSPYNAAARIQWIVNAVYDGFSTDVTYKAFSVAKAEADALISTGHEVKIRMRMETVVYQAGPSGLAAPPSPDAADASVKTAEAGHG